jgi:hypothetical protein
MLNRLPLVPAAAGLILYAGLAGFEATHLRHAGAWMLPLVAAVLAGAAAALLARALWAFVFAMVFWIATALGWVTLAVIIGRDALTSTSGAEWAGVRNLFVGMTGLVLLVVGGLSAMVAVALGVAWRVTTPARSAPAWLASSAVALCGVALVGWLVGYHYVYRQLRQQNQCLGETGQACYSLVNDLERYTKAERQAFALHGCEAGVDSVCGQLVVLLDARHGADSAEARALDARCRSGNPQMCEKLGLHLAKIRDGEAAARYLMQTCTLDVRWCDSAAEAAEEGGLRELALTLLEQGCERDDARACRGLLRRPHRSRPPADVAALELKTCLIGDVNDCRTLMRADLRGVCPRICEGTTPNRTQSCEHCAREAEAAGELQLAEEWFTATCQSPQRWGCDDLARLRGRASTGRVPKVSR